MSDADGSTFSLEISRWLDAPPESVFDAWLSKNWGEWLAPLGAHCEVIALEPHIGGSYHVRLSRPRWQPGQCYWNLSRNNSTDEIGAELATGQ